MPWDFPTPWTLNARLLELHKLVFWLRIHWDNGKENGNCYLGFRVILRIYWDNGKENGNCYLGFRVILRIYWDNGKENGNWLKRLSLYVMVLFAWQRTYTQYIIMCACAS